MGGQWSKLFGKYMQELFTSLLKLLMRYDSSSEQKESSTKTLISAIPSNTSAIERASGVPFFFRTSRSFKSTASMEKVDRIGRAVEEALLGRRTT